MPSDIISADSQTSSALVINVEWVLSDDVFPLSILIQLSGHEQYENSVSCINLHTASHHCLSESCMTKIVYTGNTSLDTTT
jgi:hypothetical protein